MAAKTTKKTASKKAAAKKAEPKTGDQLGTKVTEGDVDEMSSKEQVAARSQDVTETQATDTHRKDYVVLKSTWGESVEHDDAHLANIEAARQAMMAQGLRPTSDGKFVGEENHPDGKSLILHYDIGAVPAVSALEETGKQSVAHAHVTLDDQHDAEAGESKSRERETGKV